MDFKNGILKKNYLCVLSFIPSPWLEGLGLLSLMASPGKVAPGGDRGQWNIEKPLDDLATLLCFKTKKDGIRGRLQ